MAKKASYEGVTIIRNNLEDLLARMLALKRDGQDAKNSSQLRELVTEASVMFVDLRRVRFRPIAAFCIALIFINLTELSSSSPKYLLVFDLHQLDIG